MRGVSPILAVMLLIMITISMTGFVYIFLQRSFTPAFNSTSSQAESLGKAVQTMMKIDSVTGNRIYIRNVGSVPIGNDSLGIYIGSTPVNYTLPADIPAGQVAEITLNQTWNLPTGGSELKITGIGATYSEQVSVTPDASAVLSLSMDEGTGTVVYDSSGYGNNGNYVGESFKDLTFKSGVYESADIGTTTSFVNESGSYALSYSNDYYNGWTLKATSGAASGLTSNVSDYVVISANNPKNIYLQSALTGFASGNSYHMYYDDETGPEWAAGKYGTGIYFDGKDDFLENSGMVPMSGWNSITVGAWVNPSVVSSVHTIFIKNGPVYFAISGGKVILRIRNSTASVTAIGSTNIPTGTWSYLTGTYNGSVIKVYLNGNLDGSIAQNGTLGGDGCFQVGRDNNGGCNGNDVSYFNGTIDSLRIWNRSLGDAEINSEMNSAHPVSGRDLIADWEFDEGSGNATKDTHNWVSGKFGTSLRFDGIDDYVNCGNGESLRINGDITVESWVNLASLGKYHSIASKWNPWIYFISPSNRPMFYVRYGGADHSVSSNTALSADTWYHVMVSHNRSNRMATFYLNGKFDGSPIFDGVMDSDSGAPLRLGSYGNANTVFKGSIDGVRIYNNSLAPDQVFSIG